MVKTRLSSAKENKKNNTLVLTKRVPVYEVKILLKKENFNLYKTEIETNSKNETASMSTTTINHNLRARREGKYKF